MAKTKEVLSEIKHPKKRAMIKALESSLGVVTEACKVVGITRATHYNWLRDDKVYASEVEDVNNITLDFAESELYKQIEAGSTTATIFLLKTRGKKRGYIERQEIDHTSSDNPISPKTWDDWYNPDRGKE